MSCPGHQGTDHRRALLLAARLLLDATPDTDDTAHEWASLAAEQCPGCAVTAALHLGFALVASTQGQEFVTGDLLARLRALVESARAELDGSVN